MRFVQVGYPHTKQPDSASPGPMLQKQVLSSIEDILVKIGAFLHAGLAGVSRKISIADLDLNDSTG